MEENVKTTFRARGEKRVRMREIRQGFYVFPFFVNNNRKRVLIGGVVVCCRRSFFFSLKFLVRMFIFTCLSPGTSVTGLPSALIHRISGRGLPVAAHSTTVPVVLEKSIRLDGSFKKTGPDRDDELAAAVAEPSPTHAPINQKKNNLLLLYGHHHQSAIPRDTEK